MDGLGRLRLSIINEPTIRFIPLLIFRETWLDQSLCCIEISAIRNGSLEVQFEKLCVLMFADPLQNFLHAIVLTCLVAVVLGQRSPYAGSRPSGYKDRFRPTSATAAPAATADNEIGNRFGEENTSGTTQRIPIDVWGDRQVFEILSRYPADKQPFWLLNYQTIEAHRQPIRGWNPRPCFVP